MMNKYQFIIPLIGMLIYAQIGIASKTDSLEKQINTSKSDTNLVNTYTDLCWELRLENPDKAINYGRKALEIAGKINFLKGKAKALNNLGVVYHLQGDYDNAINFYKKTIEVQRKTADLKGIAQVNLNIGTIYLYQSKYELALSYYRTSLNDFIKIKNQKGISQAYNAIGFVYEGRSEYLNALTYFIKSLKICEKMGDNSAKAQSLGKIGDIYNYLNNNDKALEYYQSALEIRIKLNDKPSIAALLNNIGSIYHQKLELDKAMDYYSKSLAILEDLSDLLGMSSILSSIGNIYTDKEDYDNALKYYFKALEINQEIGSLSEIGNCYYQIGSNFFFNNKHELALKYLYQSLDAGIKIGEKELVKNTYEKLALILAQKGDFVKAYNYQRLYSMIKDTILNEETQKQITQIEGLYQNESKKQQIKLQKEQLARKEVTISKQRTQRNALILGFLMLAALVIVIYNGLQRKRKDNKIIAAEKEKSEKLLLNTLPLKVVNELKESGFSEPESFDQVTVYFSDIVGFTNISSALDPKILIKELNEIFTAFDDIMNRHQCERIKTIGDAYLAVCGMPEKNEQHAEQMLLAAIEIIHFLEKRSKDSGIGWRVRIGIHSGKVVGGIVGVRKYIYDVFGDTINTASRMESNGEPMRINISETTYNFLKHKFNFTARPISEIKGKGNMQMYFYKEEK